MGKNTDLFNFQNGMAIPLAAVLMKGGYAKEKKLMILSDGILDSSLFISGMQFSNYKTIDLMGYVSDYKSYFNTSTIVYTRQSGYCYPWYLEDGLIKTRSRNYLSTVIWSMPLKHIKNVYKTLNARFHWTSFGGSEYVDFIKIGACECDDVGNIVKRVSAQSPTGYDANVDVIVTCDVSELSRLDYLEFFSCDGTIVMDKVWLE